MEHLIVESAGHMDAVSSSKGAQVVAGLVIAADTTLWHNVLCNLSTTVSVTCPASAKPHGICLLPMTVVYFHYEHKSLTGPFHLQADGPITITAEYPTVQVTVQRAATTQQAVLDLDSCAHLHIEPHPTEPLVLTDSQVEGLRCMIGPSRCGTPVFGDATNHLGWQQEGQQQVAAPNRRHGKQKPPAKAPSKSPLPFSHILVNTRGIRSTLESSASMLLAEFCIACVPPVRPAETWLTQRDMANKENPGAMVYVHEITLPPLCTAAGTRLLHPHKSSAMGSSREHAAERAAANTLQDLVQLNVLPQVTFGGVTTAEGTNGKQALQKLEKRNTKLQRALSTAEAVAAELKRQLMICNEAREELAAKAFQQQDLLFRQQLVLKEQHTNLLEYQKMLKPNVKRYSVRELIEMRAAKGGEVGGVLPDTSQLPFVDGLAELVTSGSGEESGVSSSSSAAQQHASSMTLASSSSSMHTKPPTPGQMQDSASSTAKRSSTKGSPERWAKGVAGKYAARYVDRTSKTSSE